MATGIAERLWTLAHGAACSKRKNQTRRKSRRGGEVLPTDQSDPLPKGRQGIVAGYNAQAMVSAMKTDEGASGMLVTAVDVVDQANDNALLVPMVEQS